MSFLRRSWSFAACLLFAAAAHAQQTAWTIEGKNHAEWFGFALTELPDRTGDGVPELLVGAPPATPSSDEGIVRVLSGSDLAVLLEVGGDKYRDYNFGEPLDRFGNAVAAAGDRDGDGIDDLLVGAPNRNTVCLLSGVDGHELATYVSANDSDFGTTLAALGDLDGDGVVDFAVGSPHEVGGNGNTGVVQVLSGATGAERFRSEASTDAGWWSVFGERGRIADFGDLDGDGLAELALLDVALSPLSLTETAVARILSGANGSELLSFAFDTGANLNFDFKSLAAAGDVNGDGTRDLAVGGLRRQGSNDCTGVLISGATGKQIRRLAGAGSATWIMLRGDFDVDGDGQAECLLACDGTNSTTPLPVVRLYRGSDGAKLLELAAPAQLQYGRTLLAGPDFDRDGLPDLALGIPDRADPTIAPFNQYPTGAIETWSLPAGAPIASVVGKAEYQPCTRSVATIVGDVDGDLRAEIAVADLQLAKPHSIRILAGSDGHEMAVHPIAQGEPLALAALPDLDGDGRDDYAVSINDYSGLSVVELRSSATGATIRTLAAPSPSWAWGAPLVVGVDASGGVGIAVGAPMYGTGIEGRVDVFDALTGAALFSKSGTGSWGGGEQLGSSIAFVGDFDGDGLGDWAVGAPLSDTAGTDAGRVVFYSGRSGKLLQVVTGNGALERFGQAVISTGDLDGDGVPDFAIGAPWAGSSQEGEVRVFSGASNSLLDTLVGPATNAGFGWDLLELDDLNKDGADDFAVPFQGQVVLFSGDRRGLLAVLPEFGVHAMAKWQVLTPTGDRIHDLIVAQPGLGFPQWPAGRWSLIQLDDLMLQIEPAVAVQGDLVSAWLRGGRPGLPLVLMLTKVNGIPVGQWIAADFFDSYGEWVVSDTVPAGLAGITAEFQGFGLDWNGKVMKSLVQPLQFE